MGDLASGVVSRYEGRGAGKIDPPGGHIKVNRKEKLREKIVTETHPMFVVVEK
jgi:hypothetical protein